MVVRECSVMSFESVILLHNYSNQKQLNHMSIAFHFIVRSCRPSADTSIYSHFPLPSVLPHEPSEANASFHTHPHMIFTTTTTTANNSNLNLSFTFFPEIVYHPTVICIHHSEKHQLTLDT